MNPLISITVSVYFEVLNSELYGGSGSIGYASVTYEDVKKNVNDIDEDFVSRQKNIVAKMLETDVVNIRPISKEEYDLKTEGEDDED